MSTDLPVLVLLAPAGRFLSMFTMKASHCAWHSNKCLYLQVSSCSFAGRHYIWNHLLRWWICHSQTPHNKLHNYSFCFQFQQPNPVPYLETVDPVHPVITKSETRGCTRDPQVGTESPPDSSNLTSLWTPENTENLVNKQSKYSGSPLLLSTHTLNISYLYYYLLK